MSVIDIRNTMYKAISQTITNNTSNKYLKLFNVDEAFNIDVYLSFTVESTNILVSAQISGNQDDRTVHILNSKIPTNIAVEFIHKNGTYYTTIKNIANNSLYTINSTTIKKSINMYGSEDKLPDLSSSYETVSDSDVIASITNNHRHVFTGNTYFEGNTIFETTGAQTLTTKSVETNAATIETLNVNKSLVVNNNTNVTNTANITGNMNTNNMTVNNALGVDSNTHVRELTNAGSANLKGNLETNNMNVGTAGSTNANNKLTVGTDSTQATTTVKTTVNTATAELKGNVTIGANNSTNGTLNIGSAGSTNTNNKLTVTEGKTTTVNGTVNTAIAELNGNVTIGASGTGSVLNIGSGSFNNASNKLTVTEGKTTTVNGTLNTATAELNGNLTIGTPNTTDGTLNIGSAGSTNTNNKLTVTEGKTTTVNGTLNTATAELNGNLTIGTPNTTDGTLNIGSADFDNASNKLTVNSSGNDKTHVHGTVNTATSTFNGNLEVDYKINSTNSITVETGNNTHVHGTVNTNVAELNGNLTIGNQNETDGNLNIGSAISRDANTNVIVTSTANKLIVTAGNTTTVHGTVATGSAELNGDLNVTGRIETGGNTTVTGATTVNDTLTTNTANLNSTLETGTLETSNTTTVTGATTVNGTLNTATAELNGNLTIGANNTTNGTLNIGSGDFDNTDNRLVVAANKTTTVHGTVNTATAELNGNLTIGSSTNNNGTLTVTNGLTTAQNTVTTVGTATSTKTATFNGNLSTNTFNATSSLTASGTTNVTNTLTTPTATFNGKANITNTTVRNNLTINNTLEGTNATVGGNLNVSNDIIMSNIGLNANAESSKLLLGSSKYEINGLLTELNLDMDIKEGNFVNAFGEKSVTVNNKQLWLSFDITAALNNIFAPNTNNEYKIAVKTYSNNRYTEVNITTATTNTNNIYQITDNGIIFVLFRARGSNDNETRTVVCKYIYRGNNRSVEYFLNFGPNLTINNTNSIRLAYGDTAGSMTFNTHIYNLQCANNMYITDLAYYYANLNNTNEATSICKILNIDNSLNLKSMLVTAESVNQFLNVAATGVIANPTNLSRTELSSPAFLYQDSAYSTKTVEIPTNDGNYILRVAKTNSGYVGEALKELTITHDNSVETSLANRVYTVKLPTQQLTPNVYGNTSIDTDTPYSNTDGTRNSADRTISIPRITVNDRGIVTGISSQNIGLYNDKYQAGTGLSLDPSSNTFSLNIANSDGIGGIKTGFNTDNTNRNYAVALSSKKAYVNVPWQNQTVKANGTAFGATDAINIVGSDNITVSGNTTNDTITISTKNIYTKTEVNNEITKALSQSMVYKGTVGTTEVNGVHKIQMPENPKVGDTYKVIGRGIFTFTDPTDNTAKNIQCDVGDMIICRELKSGSTAAKWDVIQGNVDLVGAQNTVGIVKNGSAVTETNNLTAVPIINGIPYHRNYTAGTGLGLSAAYIFSLNAANGSSLGGIKNGGDITMSNGSATVNNHLRLTGGTMTGAITMGSSIKFNTGNDIKIVDTNVNNKEFSAIKFVAGDTNGAGIKIGAGGLTVIGSGEAVDTVTVSATNEDLYLVSDGNIYFSTNRQNPSDTNTFKNASLNTAGDLSIPRNITAGGNLNSANLNVTGNATINGNINGLGNNGGGIFWNQYCESNTDNTDAASITVTKGTGNNGTVLQIAQMNDINDIIRLKAGKVEVATSIADGTSTLKVSRLEGTADAAKKLVTSSGNYAAGNATQPVYFNNGVPVATTYELHKTVPSNAVFTDTKNTAGSSNSTSKLYLVGTTAQTSNSDGVQSYSNSNLYATNGSLTAQTLNVTSNLRMQYNTTDKCLEFVFS